MPRYLPPLAQVYAPASDEPPVVLRLRNPERRVFEEVGSATLTVRSQVIGDAALVVRNPAGIFRLSGLPAMTF